MNDILKPNSVTHGDSLVLVPGLPDACVDAVISDWPYEVDIAKWDVTPYHLSPHFMRISRGPVVLFGAAPRMHEDLAALPKPDRILIWAPAFTMSHTQSAHIFYRFHPIYVWRIPEKHDGPKHDVLKHSTEGGSGPKPYTHKCAKPVALLADLAGFCPDGGNILDPFGGAGSTAVGAMKRGRTASLIEIDPVHVETARGRVEAERRGQSYAAYLSGQQAMFGGI